MHTHTLTIPRRPKAKARPRHTKKGAVFTPKATLDEERVIRGAWETTIQEKFEGPVEIHLVYTPKETIIHIVEAPHSAGTLKGDLDNYVKLTLDALNGAAWEDDGQVVRITAVKTDLAKENWSSHETGKVND